MTLAEKLSTYDEKYWDFSEYRNHAPLVRYPAVMVAPMQACILKEIINTDPTTSTVLDPFCGSGTVLCEGKKLGLNVMGFDINPLAVLIATVQLEGIPADCAARSINAINTRLTMLNGNVKPYAFKNINKWFNDDIIVSLSVIRQAIIEETNDRMRRFFWCCFAETVKKFSNTRTSTFKLHVKERSKIEATVDDTITFFKGHIQNNYLRYVKDSMSSICIKCGDSKEHLDAMDADSVDLICTSPPYGDNHTTVTYGQFSILPLLWIDKKDLHIWDETMLETFTAIDSASLGGRIKRKPVTAHPYSEFVGAISLEKQKKVIAFLEDYEKIFSLLARVLKPGKLLVLTLGNRRVDNKEIAFDVFNDMLAQKYGMELDSTITRNTSPSDHSVHKITLDKNTGAIEHLTLKQNSPKEYTKAVLRDVSKEIISFLSSEAEVRKLRHICTSLYKGGDVPFPQMQLHIINQQVDSQHNINFTCDFPQMLYDVTFGYSKKTNVLRFCCNSPNKQITSDEITLTDFALADLQKIMLEKYGIKETIPTRTNDLFLSDFSSVPTFEGRILVYEKSLAGAQLKTYGAGVNVYVNEFALYNYLAEENDWLGLADYSQRKKVTRLKPHNVFGYVNFPEFDENEEILRISNERADFIQDLTFSKVMYLLKGVVMFMILNIDVADKNPKYKSQEHQTEADTEPTPYSNDGTNTNDDAKQDEKRTKDNTCNAPAGDTSENSTTATKTQAASASNAYEPSGNYSPKKLTQKSLVFTKVEGQIIDDLVGQDDLSNKIHDLVFELYKLDLQVHRHAIAYLFRALLESATKYLSRRQTKVQFNEKALETSVVSALNYFGDQCKTNEQLHNKSKTIRTWRDTVTQRKLIDTLNQYIHNEQPVDALLLLETWNTMKGYIITCLTVT